jgi:hypothetical protein
MKHHTLSAVGAAAIVAASFLISSLAPAIASAAGPALVNLGSAGNFVILAKSGISTTGSTAVTGNIGVSPISASALTGFGLTMDSSNQFSTSPQVTGQVYAADYAVPTPATMTAAVSDMQTAYIDAAGRTNPTATELGAGNIAGMTLAPGLYKWSTNVIIPTDVTLSGSSNDVWIFQIGQNLTVGSGVHIVLSGGAQASHIFWQVAGQTTLGTTADFSGNILDQTAIVLNTGATLHGRALAQTAVTLDANVVGVGVITTTPAPVVVPVTPPVVTPVPVVQPVPVVTPVVTPVVQTPVPTTTTTTTVPVVAPAPSFPGAGLPPQSSQSWIVLIIASALILSVLASATIIGGRSVR